ncbi:TetR/AcrR family transcriptional regulator [Nonomuraea sp. FMUSA5-5]|uniref:TetR/AcrR family transcriptional regulator n=1 Tax=Nonomuraea composti TaxID=2720023 RepID=A0ABX1BFV6_9ACTN|nr:TetR/AcrR family transcriptional regulator [Nonomuraea sp. FMUSA5-5]NJP93718.1 TetR/AcrR family transcriptional regulator [Nonomuraea sp. FMUSA5-5]
MARQREFDRETALESALLTFWRHGYEATSVAELTAAMGIRPPSLYAAFGDKRRLFEEAVRRYQQTYGAFTTRALAEEPTGRGAIERVLREAAAEYASAEHPRGCLVITAAVNCGPESAEVEALLRGFRQEAKAAIKRRIDDDVAAGRLPAATDTAGLATFYAATIQGMSTQSRDGASYEDLLAVATLAMTAWPAVDGSATTT